MRSEATPVSRARSAGGTPKSTIGRIGSYRACSGHPTRSSSCFQSSVDSARRRRLPPLTRSSPLAAALRRGPVPRDRQDATVWGPRPASATPRSWAMFLTASVNGGVADFMSRFGAVPRWFLDRRLIKVAVENAGHDNTPGYHDPSRTRSSEARGSGPAHSSGRLAQGCTSSAPVGERGCRNALRKDRRRGERPCEVKCRRPVEHYPRTNSPRHAYEVACQ